MSRAAPIAALRRRLILEHPVDAPDQTGGFARQWQAVATLWAQVEPVRAEQVFSAERAAMHVTHRIRLRWRPDINGAMRLRDGARLFVIMGAHDADDRRRWMICVCREETP